MTSEIYDAGLHHVHTMFTLKSHPVQFQIQFLVFLSQDEMTHLTLNSTVMIIKSNHMAHMEIEIYLTHFYTAVILIPQDIIVVVEYYLRPL